MNDLQIRIADCIKTMLIYAVFVKVFLSKSKVSALSKNGTVMMRQPLIFLPMKVILLSAPHDF